MKILGKPYAGKLHVRFDEGEEEDKDRKCGLTLYRLFSSFLLYRLIISHTGHIFFLTAGAQWRKEIFVGQLLSET